MASSSNKSPVTNNAELKVSLPLAVPKVCPVCVEDMGDGEAVTLGCDHAFHSECIITWCKIKKKRATCPCCRARLTYLCRHRMHFRKLAPGSSIAKDELDRECDSCQGENEISYEMSYGSGSIFNSVNELTLALFSAERTTPRLDQTGDSGQPRNIFLWHTVYNMAASILSKMDTVIAEEEAALKDAEEADKHRLRAALILREQLELFVEPRTSHLANYGPRQHSRERRVWRSYQNELGLAWSLTRLNLETGIDAFNVYMTLATKSD